MVLWDNMSGCRGLTITLSEGQCSPATHTFLFSRTPKIRLHISLSFSPRLRLLQSPLFVKANTFLPACGSLVPEGKPDTTAEWFALTCGIVYAEIWQNPGWQCRVDVSCSDHRAKHFLSKGWAQVMYKQECYLCNLQMRLLGHYCN